MFLQATCVELTSRCWGPRDPLLLSVPLMPLAQWECGPAPLGPSLRPDNKTECPKVEVINSRSRRCDWRLQRCELPIPVARSIGFLNIDSKYYVCVFNLRNGDFADPRNHCGQANASGNNYFGEPMAVRLEGCPN